MVIETPMMMLAPALEAERMVQKTHDIRADRRKYLAKAFCSGDKRKLSKALNGFFNDKRVKMSALHKARERHPNVSDWQTATKSLCPFTPFPEPVNWWPEPKPNGGYRILCDLPRPLKATHYLIADALYAQMDVPPFIFDLRGRGRDKAVLGLLEKLKTGFNSYRVFDVKDCFQNINPEVIRELPLPRRIIENALIIENLSLQRVEKLNATETGDVLSDTLLTDVVESGPSGLMQGSPASNVILAYLLREIPNPDNDDWLLFVYADDLIVVARRDGILERVEQKLLEFFERPQLGPLPLKTKAAGTSGAFEYLGCEFRHNSILGDWTLSLSQKSWDKLARNRYAEVMKYKLAYPDGMYVDEEKSIRGVVSSFPLKEGRDAIRAMALDFGPDWIEVDNERKRRRNCELRQPDKCFLKTD